MEEEDGTKQVDLDRTLDSPGNLLAHLLIAQHTLCLPSTLPLLQIVASLPTTRLPIIRFAHHWIADTLSFYIPLIPVQEIVAYLPST